jgi:CDP-4-dehydro-6-deoxyglucose reductase
MPTLWYDATIIDIKNLSPNTKQFSLEVKGIDSFSFIPGQFITFDLPVSEKRLDRWKSYSISNAPSGKKIIELCIVRSENGLGTKYLFEEIRVGSVLKFKGPDGSFIIPDSLDKEIIMLCTGTGVAPFRSMLKHIEHLNLPFNKIHLIFGTRNESGTLYMDEWQRLSKMKPNFQFDIALSREQKAGFYNGYIHDIYIKKYAAVREDRIFYICGWSGMVDQAVSHIIDMGYHRTQIRYELYG